MEQLTDAALKGVPLESSPALCRLICQPADAGWQLTHDRCWFLTADHRDLKMFQRLEQGENVAMCKFSPLPKIDPKNQVALEQFQSDVQRPWARTSATSLRRRNPPTARIIVSTE